MPLGSRAAMPRVSHDEQRGFPRNILHINVLATKCTKKLTMEALTGLRDWGWGERKNKHEKGEFIFPATLEGSPPSSEPRRQGRPPGSVISAVAQGPLLGLRSCCRHVEILDTHFYFALSPEN